MRAMVRFSKRDAARYISHLDLIRLMQRVLRRAGVPLCYTQGFHPHPKMAFASALGVGIESCSEYMDLWLERDMDPAQCADAINSALPPSMRVLGVKPLSSETKGLMGMVTAASYDIFIPLSGEVLAKRCQGIMDAGTYPATVRKKDGPKEIDIRAGLHRLDVKNGGIDLLADAGSVRNLHPIWFVDVLWPMEERKNGQAARIVRTDLYGGKNLTSMWDMEA